MGQLHENHRAVGALLGGGLLESAVDAGGLLKAEANVLVGCVQGLLVGCLSDYFCGWLTCLMGGWLSY